MQYVLPHILSGKIQVTYDVVLGQIIDTSIFPTFVLIQFVSARRFGLALLLVDHVHIVCKKGLKKLNLNQTINFLRYKFFINSFFMIHFGKRIPLKFRASEIFV